MVMPSVGIIGCGWLGESLAHGLLKDNYSILATVRRDEKKQQLEQAGIPCDILFIPDDVNSDHAVFAQQILVIAITPKFKQGLMNYASNIKAILAVAEQKNIPQVILVSSSGVYGNLTGEVDELTPLPKVLDAKANLLSEAEQAVMAYPNLGQVLRLTGLVGEDRQPGRFLAGKVNLAGANQAVNVIHKADATGLLIQLIKKVNTSEKLFVGVSATNTTRKQYYQEAARVLNLVEPTFNAVSDVNTLDLITAKKVVGENTRQWLDYQYQFDDLFSWLTTHKLQS